MRSGCSSAHFAREAGICFAYGCNGIRDFKMIAPSGRRSTAISRSNHSMLRKAAFFSTVAAFPLISSLPDRSVAGPSSFLSPDIDRFSLLHKGSDAFAEVFRAAAQHLIAVFHRDHGFDRAGVDAHIE